jgi:hypothetical protein
VVHLISYELRGRRSRFEYDRIADAIKDISGIWCHIPESKWLIETELTTQQVADRIAPLTLIGDTIFVTRIYNDWYSYSLTEGQLDWLRTRNYSSVMENVLNWLPLPRPVTAAAKLAPLLIRNVRGMTK